MKSLVYFIAFWSLFIISGQILAKSHSAFSSISDAGTHSPTCNVSANFTYELNGLQITCTIINPVNIIMYEWTFNQAYSNSTITIINYTSDPVTFTYDPSLNQYGWVTLNAYSADGCYANSGTSEIFFDNLCEFSIPSNLTSGLSSSTFPNGNGPFKKYKHDGRIVFSIPNCPVELPFSCFFGIPPAVPNVVSTNTATFQRPTSPTGNPSGLVQKESYVYSTDLLEDNNHDKNYNYGVYDMYPFSFYQPPGTSPRQEWLRNSIISKFSLQRDGIEQINAIGVKKVVKLGYGEAVPYITVDNSNYENCFFESYEKTYNYSNGFSYTEDNVRFPDVFAELDPTVAHAGKQSIKLKSVSSGFRRLPLRSIIVEDPNSPTNVTVKFWVRFLSSTTASLSPSQISNLCSSLKIKVNSSSSFQYDVKKIATTGEWTLCESNSFVIGSAESNALIEIAFTSSDPDITTWIDDVRMQPTDSKMETYVYDPRTLKVLAIFDDQHFGLYYQYNEEGKLVRKQKETERGFKTIQETQYNLPATYSQP